MKRYVFFFFAMLLLLTSGCGTSAPKGSSGFMTVTDSAGRTVHLDKKPERVILLTPTLAEIQHAVGGDFVAMGSTPSVRIPDYAKNKPSVGMSYQVDMEALISMKPDLVVGLNGLNNGIAQGLEQNRVPFLLFSLSAYDDVKRAVEILAEAAGNRGKGKEVCADLDRRMRETIDSLPKEKATFAVIHGTGKSLTIESKGSIACDVAERIGLSNVFEELKMKDIGHMPPFSMEQLAVKDPDIIFLTTMVHQGKESDVFRKSMMAHPAWGSMRAVKNGKVYLLPQALFLSSPGIHYPEAVQVMADMVYSAGKGKEGT